MRKHYFCIRNKNKTQPKNRAATYKRHKKMKAFIEINPKNHKNGQIFINDQVQNLNDCHKWFGLNREYLETVAKRKNIESVRMYVKEQYNIIDSYTIF